jgi:ketosteroid isomerase-like protein
MTGAAISTMLFAGSCNGGSSETGSEGSDGKVVLGYLFDRGVFTLTPERKMVVSQYAHGTHGFEEWLMRFNGQFIREPIQPYYYPSHIFLNWHVREVFKGVQYRT